MIFTTIRICRAFLTCAALQKKRKARHIQILQFQKDLYEVILTALKIMIHFLNSS